MRRRDFIKFLGGGTIGWPGIASAKSTALPVVGYLSTLSPKSEAKLLVGFQKGLSEAGYVDGRNVAVDYHWLSENTSELAATAAAMVKRPVSVLVAIAPPAARAVKAATSTIPIVFMVGTDPVKEGLVASLNKPGGNATGIDLLINRLEAKKLGLFREMLPQATKFAILINPAFPPSRLESSEIMAAARILKIDVELFRASNADEIETAFRSIAQQQFPGLIVGADTFFQTEFATMSALSAQYELPVIAFDRAFPAVGGLMSYGIDLVDAHRQVGLYVGRILSGAKPADLPVTEPNKFELVIDVKTARSLDLTVPASLLAIADDVIE